VILHGADAEADAVLQHIKIVLLLAVLLRHFQRYTVRTCHSWSRIPPVCAPTCVFNNLMQTGAAEGLALFSGAAISRAPLSTWQVMLPFVVLLLFRHVLHPLLEWLIAGADTTRGVDIGTAHLWFVLMLGLGRCICYPLGVLIQTRVTWASNVSIAVAIVLLGWRLLFAPAHISDAFSTMPSARSFSFYFFFGDKNFAQVVHNLPLAVLGYALPPTTVPALLARRPTRTSCVIVCILAFIVDPIAFGIFPKAAQGRENGPLLVYSRAALRIAALACVLPRGSTPITAGGRSQLLAYLLHDCFFSIGWLALGGGMVQALMGTDAEHATSRQWGELATSRWQRLADGDGFFSHVWLVVCALLLLGIYVGICLAVQLSLSQPYALFDTALTCVRPVRSVAKAMLTRSWLYLRQAGRRHFGNGYKRLPVSDA